MCAGHYTPPHSQQLADPSYAAPVQVGPIAARYAALLDEKIPKIRGRAATSELIANLKPGITVSLVSLPLSISLAIAAGADPVQGIITAAWAGLTSAVFGGSHYNVVGPTGALSGILSEFSVEYGPGIQPLLAVLAGLICLLVWVLRLERFFVFVPGAVMHGFTLGVALIIALNQLNFVLGLYGLPKHPEFISNLYETATHAGKAQPFAFVFFAVAYGSLYTLQRYNGRIPWSIVLSIIGIAIGALQANVSVPPALLLRTIQAQYGDLQLELVNFNGMSIAGVDTSSPAVWEHIGLGALSVAVVAVLETLISAFIADRMTKSLFNQRNEVLAVGLANLASGATGGIPATAALARTALNIKSGATSRAAGIVNAISIIILSTALFDLFKYLPLPVVGAILVNVAMRMVEWPEVYALARMDKPMFAVALIAMATCIIADPTYGIIVGSVLAMIRTMLAMRMAHATLRLYRGTRCALSFLFDTVDVLAVRTARARFLGEALPEGAEDAGEVGDDGHADVVAAAAAPSATVAAVPVESGAAAPPLPPAPPSSLDYEMAPDPIDESLPLTAFYAAPGYFTYVSVQAHRDRIRALFTPASSNVVPGLGAVVISLQEVYYADPDCVEALGDLISELHRAGLPVYLTGFHARVRAVLAGAHWFHDVQAFADYGGVIEHMRAVIGRGGNLLDEQHAAAAAAHAIEVETGGGGDHAAAAATAETPAAPFEAEPAPDATVPEVDAAAPSPAAPSISDGGNDDDAGAPGADGGAAPSTRAPASGGPLGGSALTASPQVGALDRSAILDEWR